MAEPRPFEEEATLYVLGRMGRAKRRRFEARLKESSELRVLVRDLEAGTVALALAMPPHEAPPQAWEHVKDAVARAKTPSLFVTWIRSGWAAAACLLIGWLIYALWVNRSPSLVSPSLVSPEIVEREPDPGIALETPRTPRQPHSPTNVVPPKATPLARVNEIATLHRQLQELEDQVAHMSQVMTQRHVFPAEPGQLEFFQLATAGADDTVGRVVKPASPELQRALLIGMARELGWLRPSTAAPPSPKPETKAETQPPATTSAPAPASASVEAPDLGVNFVDLPAEDGAQPPATTPIGAEEAKKLKSILAEPATSAPESASSDSPESAVPAFRSGTNLVLAVDSSVIPSSGTNPVTVWTGPQFYGASAGAASYTSQTPGTGLTARGSFTFGNSPTVVTIPWPGAMTSAGPIIFTWGGSSNPGGPRVIRLSPSP